MAKSSAETAFLSFVKITTGSYNPLLHKATIKKGNPLNELPFFLHNFATCFQ
jgi:hypothetical protein